MAKQENYISVNVSRNTYDEFMKKRLPGESMNTLLRRITKLPVDPTRNPKTNYYTKEKQDTKKAKI